MDKKFLGIYRQTKDFTMTGTERMYALYKAVKYIIKSNVPGDIVECGVWKGGSCMVAALTLKTMSSTSKKLYLYDTYKGITKPGKIDSGAVEKWREENYSDPDFLGIAPLDEARKNLYATGYPKNNFVFIQGPVETTIPAPSTPKKIALLRLDTDWYQSTYHELTYLYPRLVKGGVIIIDDYGHWPGARKACDKYFKVNNINILLNRIDYTGRIGIKTKIG